MFCFILLWCRVSLFPRLDLNSLRSLPQLQSNPVSASPGYRLYTFTITFGSSNYFKYQCLLSSPLKLHNLPSNQAKLKCFYNIKHLGCLDLLFHISLEKKNNCNLFKTKYFLIHVIFKIKNVFKLKVSIHNFSHYLHLLRTEQQSFQLSHAQSMSYRK